MKRRCVRVLYIVLVEEQHRDKLDGVAGQREYLVSVPARSLRRGTQLFRADAFGAFNNLQAALKHNQNTQIGDNAIYHAGSGQGQAALLQNFTVAMLVGVVHDNHNAANT